MMNQDTDTNTHLPKIADLPAWGQQTVKEQLATQFDEAGGLLTVGQIEHAGLDVAELTELRWIEAPPGRWSVNYQPGAAIRALMRGPAGLCPSGAADCQSSIVDCRLEPENPEPIPCP